MESYRCPQCGASTVLTGMLGGQGSGGPISFFPWRGGLPIWITEGAGLSYTSYCCLACGLLWNRVKPDDVRALIASRGKALAQQCLLALEQGPGHDLPDLPEAQRAAEAVLEIDTLVLEGKQPAAVRRFRDLAHVTWDEAHAVLRRWTERERSEKLSLFGWQTKATAAGSHGAALDHPMRDPLLDG